MAIMAAAGKAEFFGLPGKGFQLGFAAGQCLFRMFPVNGNGHLVGNGAEYGHILFIVKIRESV